LTPGNFSSFSDTLRYFISGLATLLAVVVSFNTLALRNQLNNMPTSIETPDRQLDKISNLLQPVINQSEKYEEQKSSAQYKKIAYTVLNRRDDKFAPRKQEIRRIHCKKNYDSSKQARIVKPAGEKF